MIGDDIVSDVGGAQACGIRGVQVRTGKFRYHHCFLISGAVYKNWEVTKDLAISRKLLFMNGVMPTLNKTRNIVFSKILQLITL